MLAQTFDRLSEEARGSVAIIFALLITVLFGFMALAVDMARAFSAQARIAAALDAAALAGAKGLDGSLTDEQIRAAALAFFEQEMSKREGFVTQSNFVVSVDRWGDSVTVSTDAQMETMFGGVVGKQTIDLTNTVTAKYRIRRIEMAMALDVTGSMNWLPGTQTIAPNPADSKLAHLKDAAKEVVKVLFEEAAADDRVRVSLVPWAASVNAGAYAGPASGNSSVDQCVVERVGSNAATDVAPYGADASRVITSSVWGYTCPTASLMPLSDRSKETELNSAIDALTGNGGTAGHIGTAWAWYTLSPAWTSIWPTVNRPRAYSPLDTIKSVLIMTDGQYNVSWKSTTTYNESFMIEESYAQFQTLCTEMKNKKMVVYTVGFGLTDTRAIDEMRNCASSSSQFFQASSGDDLKNAFKEVAIQLKQMRLTR